MNYQFRKGDTVCTNDQGRRYYLDARKTIRNGVVVEVVAHILKVRIGNPDTAYIVTVHDNCVDHVEAVAAPSQDEIDDAIASITKTPRRGQ